MKYGEYVRTINKGIRQIAMINENKAVNKYWYFIGYEDGWKTYAGIKTTEVVKHSKSIIDLIEEGDFVNGYKVLDVVEDMKTGEIHLEMPTSYPEYLGNSGCEMYEKHIKTILTKEQYAQNCFRIGEENE